MKSSENRIIAYYKAIYEIVDLDIELQIGKRYKKWDRYLQKKDVSNYAIITPFNPGSRALTKERNARRMKQFKQRLRKREIRHSLRGMNRDVEERWPDEESVVLLDIELSICFDLATHYDQSAFVYGHCGLPPFLVWTHSPL